MTNIRVATAIIFELIWPTFHEVVSAGDTYSYERDTSKVDAFKIWIQIPRNTYVVEEKGEVLGTYYIKTNQAGPGDHVCSCGYMVSSTAPKPLLNACVTVWERATLGTKSKSCIDSSELFELSVGGHNNIHILWSAVNSPLLRVQFAD